MFRVFLITLLVSSLVSCAYAQTTYSSWRQRLSASGCSSLTNGQPSDLCLEQHTPALYACNNGGAPCTTASQWDLMTPFYLNGNTVSTVGNYTMQFGTSGTGLLASNSGINIDGNNDGIYEISIDAFDNLSLPALGAANSGTIFLCLDTLGHVVKSVSPCSGS